MPGRACVAPPWPSAAAPPTRDLGGGMIEEQRAQLVAPSEFGSSQMAQFIGEVGGEVPL